MERPTAPAAPSTAVVTSVSAMTSVFSALATLRTIFGYMTDTTAPVNWINARESVPAAM